MKTWKTARCNEGRHAGAAAGTSPAPAGAISPGSVSSGEISPGTYVSLALSRDLKDTHKIQIFLQAGNTKLFLAQQKPELLERTQKREVSVQSLYKRN